MKYYPKLFDSILNEQLKYIKKSERHFIKELKTKWEDSIRKEAEDIFERFKKGEKLSTEDLMILQKAGLL